MGRSDRYRRLLSGDWCAERFDQSYRDLRKFVIVDVEGDYFVELDPESITIELVDGVGYNVAHRTATMLVENHNIPWFFISPTTRHVSGGTQIELEISRNYIHKDFVERRIHLDHLLTDAVHGTDWEVSSGATFDVAEQELVISVPALPADPLVVLDHVVVIATYDVAPPPAFDMVVFTPHLDRVQGTVEFDIIGTVEGDFVVQGSVDGVNWEQPMVVSPGVGSQFAHYSEQIDPLQDKLYRVGRYKKLVFHRDYPSIAAAGPCRDLLDFGILPSTLRYQCLNAVGVVQLEAAGYSGAVLANPFDNWAYNQVSDVVRVDGNDPTPNIEVWPDGGTVCGFAYNGTWSTQCSEGIPPDHSFLFINNLPTPVQMGFAGHIEAESLFTRQILGNHVWNWVASPIPRNQTLGEMGLPAEDGDEILTADANGVWEQSFYSTASGAWIPDLLIPVGQGFVIISDSGGTWSQSFSIWD